MISYHAASLQSLTVPCPGFRLIKKEINIRTQSRDA